MEEADESITDAVAVKEKKPKEYQEPQTDDPRLLRAMAGEVQTPGALPPEFQVQEGALEAARAIKAERMRKGAMSAAVVKKRQREIGQTATELAREPIGTPVSMAPYAPGINPQDPQFRGERVEAFAPLASNDPRRLQEQARMDGVDLRGRAPMSTRLLASMGDVAQDGKPADPNITPGLKYLVLDKELRGQAKVPESVPVVYKERNTGDLVYLRRVTEDDVAEGRDNQKDLGKLRPTMIDPRGIDLGDVAEFVPDLASGTLESIAALGGGALGSPAGGFGAVAGAGAGAALYAGMDRKARVALVKLATGLTDKEIEATGADTSFDEFSATLAGAGEVGTAAFLTAKQYLKGRKRTLTAADIADIRKTWDQNRQLFEDVERFTGVKILPDKAGAPRELLSESPDVLVEAGATRARQPAYKQRQNLATARNADVNVATATRALINDNIPGSTAYTPTEIQQMGRTDSGLLKGTGSSADAVSAQAAQGITDPLTRARASADAAQARLDAATATIPDKVNRPAYTNIQNITDKNVSDMQKRASGLWDTFDELVEFHAPSGQAGIVLANPKDSAIHKYGRNLIREANVALSQGSATKKVKLVDDLNKLLAPEKQVGNKMVPNDTVDMKQLHVLHSQLKQLSRQMGKGQADNIGFDKADIDGMVTAIEEQVAGGKMVRTRTGRNVPKREEDIRLAWLNAADATTQLKRIGQARAVRDLLTTKPVVGANGKIEGHRFQNLPGNVRTALLKANDASTLLDVIEAAGNNPEIKASMGRELMREYRQQVMPEGKFRQLAHEKFMADYGDHMEAIFGTDAPADIRNIETMGRFVDKETQRAAKLETLLKREFGDSVNTTDPLKYPSNMAEHLLTSGNVNVRQIRGTMQQLERLDPKLAADVRAHAGQWLEAKLLNDKVPQGADAYRTLVRNHGDRLNAMFGPEMASNLNRLGRVVSVLSGEVMEHGPRDPQQAAWLQMTRTIFGPMSSIQRKITSGNRIIRQIAATRSMQIISDPAKLERYMRLEKMSPQSLAFRSESYSLLGRQLTDAMIGEDPAYDKKVAEFQEMRGNQQWRGTIR